MLGIWIVDLAAGVQRVMVLVHLTERGRQSTNISHGKQ